jgi:hypothetical protein
LQTWISSATGGCADTNSIGDTVVDAIGDAVVDTVGDAVGDSVASGVSMGTDSAGAAT